MTTRIFLPEPGAASKRLQYLVAGLSQRYREVLVLTSKYRRAPRQERKGNIRILRNPVLRDKTGAVRGYIQYLSFDIPLFFRLLTVRRPSVFICEPPPTTGVITRIAATIRRVPYVAYAADILSDAAETQGSHPLVCKVVRLMEKFTFGGASRVIAVSPPVAQRVQEISGRDADVVPFGVSLPSPELLAERETALQSWKDGEAPPRFVYAGTVAPWLGADVFLTAMPLVWERIPDARLEYFGLGSGWEDLRARVAALDDPRINAHDAVPVRQADVEMAQATVTLASMQPANYEMAYTTKMLSSLAVGTPVVYAGTGLAVADITDFDLGEVAAHEPQQVAAAMVRILERLRAEDPQLAPERLRHWVQLNHSAAGAGELGAQVVAEAGGAEAKGNMCS